MFRRIVLLSLTVAFLSLGTLLGYWAYENALRWYHDTYVEPDASAAEADRMLLWVQVPTCLLSLAVGGFTLRRAIR